MTAGLVDELQDRFFRSVAKRLHPAEMELRKGKMGDRRFGRQGASGAVELFERAVHVVVDTFLTGHFDRSPDSGWYSTTTRISPIRLARATTWIRQPDPVP